MVLIVTKKQIYEKNALKYTLFTCLRVKDAPAKFTRVTQRTLKWLIHNIQVT